MDLHAPMLWTGAGPRVPENEVLDEADDPPVATVFILYTSSLSFTSAHQRIMFYVWSLVRLVVSCQFATAAIITGYERLLG